MSLWLKQKKNKNKKLTSRNSNLSQEAAIHLAPDPLNHDTLCQQGHYSMTCPPLELLWAVRPGNKLLTKWKLHCGPTENFMSSRIAWVLGVHLWKANAHTQGWNMCSCRRKLGTVQELQSRAMWCTPEFQSSGLVGARGLWVWDQAGLYSKH